MSEFFDEEHFLDNYEMFLSKIDEFETLRKLHEGVWKEALVEPPFAWFYLHVLFPKERLIVDAKIAGKSNKQIANNLQVSESTVLRSIYNIRYVLRNKARPRVERFWKFRRKRKF